MGEKDNKYVRASAQTKARPKEYEEEFKEAPVLPSTRFASKKLDQIHEQEPYFRKALAGIGARLSAVINSKAFRDALAGMEIRDDWIEVSPGKFEREYDVHGNGLSDADKAKKDEAETMVNKLKWCMTGLLEIDGGIEPVEGLRQSYQLGELLKRDAPGGGTVLDALIQAADKVEKLEGKPNEPNKKDEAEKADELLINVDRAPEEPDRPKPTLQKDLYSDLYYLDKTVGFGLNMARRYPKSVVKPADLSKVKSWQGYLDAQLNSVPLDPAQQKEHLAKVLVGAFQAGRSSARSILGGPAAPAKPFSASKAADYVKQLKEQPAFKHACKDPTLVKELLTPDPKHPHKQFNAMMNMFRPFGNIEPAHSRQVLENLQKMLPYLDKDAGRSSKWKDFTKSIRTIDLNDPNQSGEKKLQEIYDATCAYMKGKKSLRDDEDQQMRFDQSLDVLAVLAEAGPYAKLAANSVVDRINEVRLGHDKDYDEISLKEYGMRGLSQHTHVPAAKPKGLDVLPENHAFMEWVPPKQRKHMEPLPYAAEYIEPLYSTEPISEMDAVTALSMAIALSRQRVYYFNSIRGEQLPKKLEAHIRTGGRAVVCGSDVDTDAMMLSQDPAVIAMAKRYTDPEARKELFRNGQLGLPKKIIQGKKIKWDDAVQSGTYKKLSRAEFKSRMLDGEAADEPLAPLDKNGNIIKHEMLEVQEEKPKSYRDAPRLDASRLDADFLTRAYQAQKDGREIHKDPEAIRQDAGLGPKNL